MVITLRDKDLLRLRRARGVCIEVLDGRVWVTEPGRNDDAFLDPGRRYRVAGDGLVLVEGEAPGAAVAVLR